MTEHIKATRLPSHCGVLKLFLVNTREAPLKGRGKKERILNAVGKMTICSWCLTHSCNSPRMYLPMPLSVQPLAVHSWGS